MPHAAPHRARTPKSSRPHTALLLTRLSLALDALPLTLPLTRCARLEMPLGLLLEEEPNPTPNPAMPNIVRVIELLDGGSAKGGGVQV